MEKPRVCILHTGGTIGMEKTAVGYAIAPGALKTRLAQIPRHTDPALPDYDIVEYAPLLDSANNTPEVWLQIAQSIAAVYDQYAGFVVLHGTDTMAYSASALAFLLEGLNKPVVLTGSQVPLSAPHTDALENLFTALRIAGSAPIAEVGLYFGGKFLRGCRSVKVDANRFDAFASPNYPVLGWSGITIQMNWNAVKRQRAESPSLTLPLLSPAHVEAFKIYPGFRPALLRSFLAPPTQGLILETYGVGAAPDQDPELLEVLQEAVRREVVIVNCSQCFYGRVRQTGYATNSQLSNIGALSAGDMTTEAALTKLFYLLSKGLDAAKVGVLMSQDLRGELTNADSLD